jgi:integrase
MNGHVVKRGKVYQAIVYKGSVVEDGVRRPQREFKTFARKNDADKWVRDRLTVLEGSSSTMPLWAFIEQYLDSKAVAKTTLVTYKNYYKNHIKDSDLGQMKLSEVTPDAIEEYERGLDISPTSVRQVHCIIRGALRLAMRKGYVEKNVAALANPPQRATYKPRVLTLDQLRMTVEAFEGHWMYLVVVLAATTGMRRGEICALQWGDVTDDALVISRAVVEVGGELTFKSTKTRKERAVPLTKVAKDALKIERARQEDLRKKTGATYDYVICDDLGEPRKPSLVSHYWRLMRPLPIRFHDLRHSVATVLARSGAHPRTVQELLGHGDITTTLRIYTQVVSEVLKEEVGRMDEAWGQSGSSIKSAHIASHQEQD